MIEAMKQALTKVRSAQQCHPNAVMTLLCEADELLEQAIATEESSATQEPKREWVGLEDWEIKKIAYNNIEFKVARAIEAKLKEKNT